VSTAVFVQQAETDDATTNQESRFSKMKKQQQSANCDSNNRRQWHRQFVAPGPAECRNRKIKNQKQ